MKRFIWVLFIIPAFALNGQVRIDQIPDSLKYGMNEVVISDYTNYKLESLTSSELKRSYTVAILNGFADDRQTISLNYDDFRIIKSAKAVLYDQYGEKIKTYRLSDFEDISTKSFSLASDSRSMYLDITHKQYPFVLSVEYEIKYNTSYIMPTWYPQSDEKQSILHASLTIESLPHLKIRYKSLNIEPDSLIENNDRTKYYWSIKNQMGFKREPFSRYLDLSPIVYYAPNKFEFDGFVGDMSSWKEFGKWQIQLNEGRNNLTDDQLTPFRETIKGASSKIDSIRRVYDYVQKNTHYVSIQLGIGGFQPAKSSDVHEQKYGDCKALSFYTQSLLEDIGIKSHYTWIYGGKYPRKVFTDFPNDYFNHIILTVPLEEDTIWLECTSQTNSFGNLGSFTGNRYGLMIGDEGGHLIKTKSYNLNDNIQSTKAKIFLEPDGKGIAEIKRHYGGMEIGNDGFEWAVLEPESKQKDWFIDNHDWGTLTLNSFESHEISDDPIPSGGFTAIVEFDKVAVKSGDRLFYTPFVFTNADNMKLPKVDRLHPIHVRYPYTEIDTVEVILPESFYPEKEIGHQKIDSKFGTYERSVQKIEDSYLFIRKFEFESGKYPASDYEEFRSFFKRIKKHDHERLVLINRT